MLSTKMCEKKTWKHKTRKVCWKFRMYILLTLISAFAVCWLRLFVLRWDQTQLGNLRSFSGWLFLGFVSLFPGHRNVAVLWAFHDKHLDQSASYLQGRNISTNVWTFCQVCGMKLKVIMKSNTTKQIYFRFAVVVSSNFKRKQKGI